VEPVDLARILADACADFERIAGERRILVACAAPPGEGSDAAVPAADVFTVKGDGERLRQVVNNLLSNAVKYSPNGGVVTLACTPQNGDVIVTVRDEGPGIPLEAQGRLFQRFYRVDGSSTRQVGGTGLGLAIAKAIVEQHSGKIWVESRPGEGSTFGFAVPRWTAGTAAEKK
jgi:signal transduction histidine kinase